MTDDKQKPDGWCYHRYREFVEDLYEDCGYSGSSGPIDPTDNLKEKILKHIFRRVFHFPYDPTNAIHRVGMEALKKEKWNLIRPFKIVYLDEEK